MLKSTVAVGFVFATLALVPARAADMMCDAGRYEQNPNGIMGMTDASKKEMATEENVDGQGKYWLKKNNRDCVMHMQEGSKE